MKKNDGEDGAPHNAKDARKFNGLIGEIAGGRRGALEEFYRHYGRFIYIAAKSIVNLPETVDEIIDDVLVKIWNNAPKLSPVKNPLGWIYTVTVNCAKDRLKANKTYDNIFEIAAEDNGIAAIENDDSFASLLAALDDDERQIILLHIAEDCSFKEIARQSGRPLSTVTSVYYRALAKIKGNLQ